MSSMANNRIFASDLRLLQQLWAPRAKQFHIAGDHQSLVEDADLQLTQNVSDAQIQIILDDATLEQHDSVELVLNFSKQNFQFGQNFEYSYIQNPDGSIRWIYPSNSREPDFLNFYSASSFLAKVRVLVLRVLFALGLNKLIRSGKLSVHRKQDSKTTNPTREYLADNRNIFTGTQGLNRKIVTTYKNDSGKHHFAKIAVNRYSHALIENERKTLQKLSGIDFKNLEIPDLEPINESGIAVSSSVKKPDSTRSENLNEQHIRALVELAQIDYKQQRLGGSAFMQQVHEDLKAINPRSESSSIRQLKSNIEQALQVLSGNLEVEFCLAHGDYTPWNQYLGQNKIGLYDWELSREAPVLFDFFHFLTQTEAILGNADPDVLREKIDQASKLPSFKELFKHESLDEELYFLLYLLGQSSYYARIYSHQKSLGREETALIGLWNTLFSQVLKIEVEEHRVHFLEELQELLQVGKTAALKFLPKNLSETSPYSDVDLVCLRKKAKTLIDWTRHHRFVKKTIINRASGMYNLEIFFEDGSFLSLDLIHAFRRKDLEFGSVAAYLKESQKDKNGLVRLRLERDFEFLACFHQLNGSGIPEKYMQWLRTFPAAKQLSVQNHLNQQYKLKGDIAQFAEFNKSISEKIRAKSKAQKENRGLRALLRKTSYLRSISRQFTSQDGFMLTLTGADGAGKSTIIADISQELEKRYRRKVVLKRHRPALLPMLSAVKYGREGAEERAAKRLPRQGKNRSTISSLIRFAYYYLDYLVGQFYVYLRYTSRGYIVIYDRYFFDFIVDSKRSNIHLGPKFPRLLYRTLIKPRYNYFLWAPAEVIRARKKELDIEQINWLNDRYKTLFTQLGQRKPHSYQCLKNIERQTTVKRIVKDCIQAA